MDNVGLDTARPQPAPQPELVAAGLVGDDNALDLAPRLARFGAPTIQKFQQCFLVGLELLERLAFDPRNNRRDEPLRLAHLDPAITVLSCSRVARDLLASKGCDIGCSVGLLNSAEGATPSP